MFEYVTFGGGETVADLFNAVAAIAGGGDFATLVKLTLVCGAAWGLAGIMAGGQMWAPVRNLAIALVVYWSLFLPTSTVLVVDRLNPAASRPVDNVPLGLAMFAGFSSKVSTALASMAEQAFAVPDDLKYTQTGYLFGSRLISETTQVKITNTHFAASLEDFVINCVFYGVENEHYDFNELANSKDIWQYLTVTKPPQQTKYFTYVDPADGSRSIMSCRQGATSLSALWQGEVNRVAGALGRKMGLGTDDTSARTSLFSKLPVASNFFMSMSNDALVTFRQAMMINAVDNATMRYASQTGNSAAMEAYASARIDRQLKATQSTAAQESERFASLLKTTLEMIMIGVFPFMIVLLVTPAGLQSLRLYFSGFIALQSWPLLYAVLHRIMLTAGQAETVASATTATGDTGLAITTIAGVATANSMIASIGAMLTLSIPAIASAIGFGGFKAAGMAGAAMGTLQRTIDDVARETSTGNFNLGNSSVGVHAFNNVAGNNMQTAGNFNDSGMTMMGDDGTRWTTFGGGRTVGDSTGAQHAGAMSLRMGGSMAHSLSQTASAMESQAEQTAVRAAQTQSAAMGQVMSSIASKNYNLSATEGMSESERSSRSEAVQQVEDAINNVSQSTGLSREKVASMFGEAAVTYQAGGGLGKIAKVLAGVGVSGKAGISGSVSGRQDESMRTVEEAVERLSQTGALDKVMSYAKDNSLAITNSEGKALNNEVSASFNQASELGRSAEATYSAQQALSQQVEAMKNNSGSYDQRLETEFVDWLATQSPLRGGMSGPMGQRQAEQVFHNAHKSAQGREDLGAYAEQFVAEKTSEIAAQYQERAAAAGLPSSSGDLHQAHQVNAANVEAQADIAGHRNFAAGAVAAHAGSMIDHQVDRSVADRVEGGFASIHADMNNIGGTVEDNASHMQAKWDHNYEGGDRWTGHVGAMGIQDPSTETEAPQQMPGTPGPLGGGMDWSSESNPFAGQSESRQGMTEQGFSATPEAAPPSMAGQGIEAAPEAAPPPLEANTNLFSLSSSGNKGELKASDLDLTPAKQGNSAGSEGGNKIRPPSVGVKN